MCLHTERCLSTDSDAELAVLVTLVLVTDSGKWMQIDPAIPAYCA